jgi:signal transduction histidine kinase
VEQLSPLPDSDAIVEHEKQVLLEHIKAQQEMLAQTTAYMLQIQEQLEESRQQLFNQNKNLEQIVEKRTGELKKAVARLEHEIEQREQAQRSLSIANQELNMLLYRSSHDFKGPVCTAFGLLSLIEPKVADKEVQEYLQLLHRPLNKLDALTRTITSIADFRENCVRAEAIDLPELVNRLLDDYQKRLGTAYPDVSISTHYESLFCSDIYLLQSILQNLLDNAFQYQARGRAHRVSISLQPYYKQLKLIISDTGTGIPEAYLSRVFDMFFRGSELATGSGLGLYLAKLSVDKLGGSISIKSTMNKGTTVTVVLPSL